jgi:methylthioribulose-1-phosphate dehydratase
VSSHEHREWIPIVDNDQDMPRLAQRVAALLEQQPDIHAFALRRHGLYTWGETLAEAERHIEILEFLFQTVGLHLQLKTRN